MAVIKEGTIFYMDMMGKMKRTHHCNELSAKDAGKEVTLMGWVQRRRDHGGVIFIDLRDREGLCQVVFNPDKNIDIHKHAHTIRNEFVIGISGVVEKRPEGMINTNLKTGEIEISVNELKIFNKATTPPFLIEDSIDVSDNIRLENRHIDLRRPALMKNIITRHKIGQAVRNYLNNLGFIDIETPMLTKSTPEGARDYLVPSRVNQGTFYALPQSPQIFKQLLMVAGFDRYYQIVKCFRDEDLRADRQPEFTQIDIEMSFIDENQIMAVAEGMIQSLFKEVLEKEVTLPFACISYKEAMDRYGLDKPDTRFKLELKDVTDIVKESGFKVFASVAKKGGMVKALNAKQSSSLSRKEIDDLADFVSIYRAKGLAWIKVKEDSWQSPIAKFFTDDEKDALAEKIEMEPGDLILFVADQPKIVNEALGHLRNHMGKKLGLIDETIFNFLWVTDFPLFDYDETEKRYQALHHPFTSPVETDFDKLKTEPASILSRAYDLVLNGSEIGGGSIRIHSADIQQQVFTALGLKEDDYKEKFGFLLDALKSGAPPHGGIAFGLDRLAMILCNQESLRDVIAFPKTQKASCLMTKAPSKASFKQLEELNLKSTL